jgi:hypothetical protein
VLLPKLIISTHLSVFLEGTLSRLVVGNAVALEEVGLGTVGGSKHNVGPLDKNAA